MKIKDILGKGDSVDLEVQETTLKQVDFHKKMKGLLDPDLQEEDKNTHLDHAEELVFMQGSKV